MASGYHDFLSAARTAGHAIATGAKAVGHGIVAAAKVVGSATGITDAINCVRNPTLVGCLTAVGKLALTASAFVTDGASLGLEAELEGGGLLAEEGLSVAADEGSSLATEEVPGLLRAGGGGAKLPMNVGSVNSVADKYGIDISGNDISINKAIAGLRGSTAPDQSITLYRGAFQNEEQLTIFNC